MSRVAYLFPGQGSQFAGMGRELYDAFPECRAVFDEADQALGEPLSRLCFEGPDEALALTENTQPAILTVSVAAARALAARGIRPAAAAGHSLGEYAAHVAAGTLSFRDAVVAVRRRGRFMQDAVPVGQGAMAALIGIEPAAAERLCAEQAHGEVLSPANFNSPEQTVLAGAAAAVDRAIAAAPAAGAKRALRLAVSAPFHCALMQPAGERLAPVLRAIAFSDPAIPVYTNVDAAPVRDAEAAREALLRQVASPVRWHPLVRAMIHDGCDTFIEVGPGRVLAGLLRRIDRAARVFSVGDAATLDEAVSALERAA